MADGKVTQDFAATFVDQLARSGVRDACISPGSRSAPLAMAFARHPAIRVWMHIDERSGSFFGTGLAKASERPVVLLCTSGTAAAEFHAAVVEASYSRTPLVVLTADRPPELREVGANQAIDQDRLYGSAVRWYCDPGPPEALPDAARAWRRLAARAVAEATGRPAGPVHLNLPFREPLTPDPATPPRALEAPAPAVHRALEPAPEVAGRFAGLLAAAERPLAVAGEMRDGARLAEPLLRLGVPVLAEPTSQLRLPGTIAAYEALLRDPGWAAARRPDLVLRLGATPTSKPLNQWLAALEATTLLVDPAAGWRDPDLRAGELFAADPAPLLESCHPHPAAEWLEAWRRADRAAVAALEEALGKAPLCEPQAVRALAAALPPEATLFVGSSMPIRDVDSFWPASPPGRLLLANRGASGIDGLVSSGLGAAAAGSQPAALLLGDLSLYHDMNGLWALRRHGLRATLVVLDNDGGGIFSFLPQAEHADVFEELFGTPLGLRLADVARLYGLDYCSVEHPADLRPTLERALAAPGSTLVRVGFAREASVRAHRACWAAVAEALRGERAQQDP